MARICHALATLALLSTFTAFVGGAIAAGQRTFVTFHCGDGTEFIAAFYPGTRSTYIHLDGKSMKLPRRISLSGARYSAGNIALRINENSATLTRGRYLSRGRKSTECSLS